MPLHRDPPQWHRALGGQLCWWKNGPQKKDDVAEELRRICSNARTTARHQDSSLNGKVGLIRELARVEVTVVNLVRKVGRFLILGCNSILGMMCDVNTHSAIIEKTDG